MYDVGLYRKVRLACHRDGMSARQAALHFGINRRTVEKMLKHSVPRGYVHEVVISCGTEIIARHPRSYERGDMVFDPVHYLALLEKKIGALDQAAPLSGWEAC